MTRVLLHAGFHKTGTTSVQDFLHRNRRLIRPQAQIVLHPPLAEVARWIRDYDLLPDPQRLQVITEEVARALSDLRLNGRDLIISHEELAGPMPLGQSALPYPHAVPLLRAVIAGLSRLGPVNLRLHFTTRPQADWVASIYGHQIRKQTKVRLTEGRDSFSVRLMAGRLEDQLAAIRAGLPGIALTSSDLSQQGTRFGPAQPFVDFLRLPEKVQAQLSPPRHLMIAPAPDVLDQMLALNRSDLDAKALIQAKKALIKASGQSGPIT